MHSARSPDSRRSDRFSAGRKHPARDQPKTAAPPETAGDVIWNEVVSIYPFARVGHPDSRSRWSWGMVRISGETEQSPEASRGRPDSASPAIQVDLDQARSSRDYDPDGSTAWWTTQPLDSASWCTSESGAGSSSRWSSLRPGRRRLPVQSLDQHRLGPSGQIRQDASVGWAPFRYGPTVWTDVGEP